MVFAVLVIWLKNPTFLNPLYIFVRVDFVVILNVMLYFTIVFLACQLIEIFILFFQF